MNAPADGPYLSRPGPNLAAGAMALGVHALFLLLLIFGVSWQTQHPAPVMVDLWDALPPLPSPTPRPKRNIPLPPPQQPEPVKAEPVPPVAAKEPPPSKPPDIALEKKKLETERLQKLKTMQEAETKALAEATRAEAEAIHKVREKQLADQKKRALLRQMEEEEMIQRMANEEAASEARILKQAEARSAATRRQSEMARAVGLHRDLISAKVRGNTRLPGNLKSNLEVRCLVKLLPTGEVQSVQVTQSSGNVAYDEAVVLAIQKSSPLPLPAERDARAEFVPELSFIHRPKE